MQAFGYTTETMQFMLLPMIQRAARPGRLDGQRFALAVCERPAADALRLLQAAVRAGDQPAIDSIREEVIMSLECYIGPRGTCSTTPRALPSLLVPHPILTNEELAALKHMDHRGWKRRRSTSPSTQAKGKAGCEGARPHLRRGGRGDR
jgi:glutamate synthase (NADPH) large chain